MPKSALYTDSGERTFHTPGDIQQSSGRNTIQLLAREAFDNTGIMHYYFMYTDNSGNQSYVSAFPENLIPPNGKIIMESGAYVSGSPDFRRSIRVGEITGSPEEVATAFNNIKGEFRRIHKNYDYLPWQNSNSAAVTALFNSGIHFKRGTPTPGDFSNVNAPGQSTDLSPKSLNKDNIKGQKEGSYSVVTDFNSNYNQATATSLSLNTFEGEKTIGEKRALAITEKLENAGISNSAAEFDAAFIGVVMNLKNLTPNDKQDILKEQGIDSNKIQANNHELVPG
jgi:hypothetical protein